MNQSTMRMEDVRKMQEIPIIFLQEYGHRFEENIHLRLPSGQPLPIHLKVIKWTTCFKVFFNKVGKICSWCWIGKRWPYHHLP
jgi:hypothetical protein